MKSQDWERVLEEYRSSGESVASFCGRRGIGKSSLRYQLSRRQGKLTEKPFIRLGEAIELELGTMKARIPATREMLELLLEVSRARG